MSDLHALASRMADLPAGRGLPPVEQWNPEYHGDIDIVIRRDGVWLHEGSPITRPELVRLFSTVLRRDGEDYFLVTPVEKLKITVEDAPFLATDLVVENSDAPDQKLSFRTNVGDQVSVGKDHPLLFRKGTAAGELLPYIHVRRGLEARLSRPVYYQLAELANGNPPGIRSAGQVFLFAETSGTA